MNDLQTVGPVPVGSPLYVSRSLLDQIERALGQGKYVTVIGGRQTGKTTLALAAEAALVQAGAVCIYIDFQGYPTESDPADWLSTLFRDVITAYVQQRSSSAVANMSPPTSASGLVTALDQLAQQLNPPALLVFLFDEITAIHEACRNSLFSSLRALFSRTSDQRYKHQYPLATFGFFGTFHPSDLIDDSNSPFNVSETFNTADHDFTVDEVSIIARAFNVEDLASEIHAATCGHPYLTVQISKHLTAGLSLDRAVNELLIGDANITHTIRALQPLSSEAKRTVWKLLDGEKLKLHSSVSEVLRKLYVQGVLKRDEAGFALIRSPIHERALKAWLSDAHVTASAPLVGQFTLRAHADAMVNLGHKLIETEPIVALICAGIAVESSLLRKLECFGAGSCSRRKFNAAVASGAIDLLKIGSGKNAPKDWSLAEMVEIARLEGLMTANDSQVLHVVRDWRNYVHPHVLRENVRGQSLTELATKAGLAVAAAGYATKILQ